MVRSRLPGAVIPAWLLAAPLVFAAPPKEEVPWKVQPDPLPWKLEMPRADRTLAIPTNASIEHPTGPSPFFALIVPEKNADPDYKIIDMRRMEAVGKPVKARIDGRYFKVSLWGDHFMSIDAKAEKPTLLLWTTTEQKVVPSIEVNEEKTKIEAHEFVGKDRVLTVKTIKENGKDKRYWQVWDVKTGKEVIKIQSQLEYSSKWIGFSPGRRYLVMQHTSGSGYELEFWDLTNGERAGLIPMQDPKDHWGQCGGITLTADGKELALIWRLMKDGVTAKIMRFDMEKGTKKGELALKDELTPSAPGFLAGGTRTFQFLPDGRGWLVSGHQIVERESGAVVWAIDPKPKFNFEIKDLRFADGYHFVTVTPGKDKAVAFTELPKADLDAAIQKARDSAPGPK